MEKARIQVEEVTDLMKGNMTKIMEREGKLTDLELRAEKLQAEGQQFEVFVPFTLMTFSIIQSLEKCRQAEKKKAV